MDCFVQPFAAPKVLKNARQLAFGRMRNTMDFDQSGILLNVHTGFHTHMRRSNGATRLVTPQATLIAQGEEFERLGELSPVVDGCQDWREPTSLPRYHHQPQPQRR